MPPQPASTPHHPLRRISTGSLSSLARSTDRNPNVSPSNLDHLSPALTDLVDEATTLSSNISQMTALHDALGTFNEAFAGYLYALKMNAFCVEWPEAPNEISFQRLPSLEVPEPIPTASAQPPTPSSASASASAPSRPSRTSTAGNPINPADLTYMTSYSESFDHTPPPPPKAKVGGAGVKKAVPGAGGVKKVAAGAAAAQRKKRELEISSIIDSLPLEYRGGEPAERMRMEKVIMKLMEHPDGLPLKEMVAPPEMPQAKVNKCLITLVAKKLVTKPMVDKVTRYKWVGA
ncbi:hypothetical protein CI109_104654 [Kwoniella shandongensis]|uniref:DASH complex subunit DAM1 n=1 Tax=Kwoniella shandongensis TaxID=1734106 RepID=A0A5M6BXC2_9TREE|nr:uncharacterized protein CI109_004820 [Kwoniella shandongensis]KAA5526820.1 hypothetical protein CI109_004820 [Kwoniella shandongensis]